MPVKLIIFGRPGSGKSATARYIKMLTQHMGLSTARLNDYDILLKMYHADVNSEKFLPTTYVEGGFDIIDFSVLNVALTKVERLAEEYISSEIYNLIILELARADYYEALRQFSSSFLQDAYFLLIFTDIKTCIDRINERTAHPVTSDDHYVSDKIMIDYYQKDNLLYMPFKLMTDYKVPDHRINMINNMGSLQDFIRRIDKFLVNISELINYPLPETDPIQRTAITKFDNKLECEQ
jgi:adenylate kinase family enzyme